MTHQHVFIRIGDVAKMKPEQTSWHSAIVGAEAGCIECGQVRRVWADGTLEIIKRGDASAIDKEVSPMTISDAGKN